MENTNYSKNSYDKRTKRDAMIAMRQKSITSDDPTHANDNCNKIISIFSIIAVCVKLLKTQNKISDNLDFEINNFKQVFDFKSIDNKRLRRFYLDARKDPSSLIYYAKRLEKIFKDKPHILRNILDRLAKFLIISKKIDSESLSYLKV